MNARDILKTFIEKYTSNVPASKATAVSWLLERIQVIPNKDSILDNILNELQDKQEVREYILANLLHTLATTGKFNDLIKKLFVIRGIKANCKREHEFVAYLADSLYKHLNREQLITLADSFHHLLNAGSNLTHTENFLLASFYSTAKLKLGSNQSEAQHVLTALSNEQSKGLSLFVSSRTKLVDEIQKRKNKLINDINNYFPELDIKSIIDDAIDLGCGISFDFIRNITDQLFIMLTASISSNKKIDHDDYLAKLKKFVQENFIDKKSIFFQIALRVKNEETLQYYHDNLISAAHKYALNLMMLQSPHIVTMCRSDFDAFVSSICREFETNPDRYPDKQSAQKYCFDRTQPDFIDKYEKRLSKKSKNQNTPRQIEERLPQRDGEFVNNDFEILRKNGWIIRVPRKEPNSYGTDYERSFLIKGSSSEKASEVNGQVVMVDRLIKEKFDTTKANNIIAFSKEHGGQEIINACLAAFRHPGRGTCLNPLSTIANLFDGANGSECFDVVVATIPIEHLNIISYPPGFLFARILAINNVGPMIVFMRESNALLYGAIAGDDVHSDAKRKDAYKEELQLFKDVIDILPDSALKKQAIIIMRRMRIVLERSDQGGVNFKELVLYNSVISIARQIILDPYNDAFLTLFKEHVDQDRMQENNTDLKAKGLSEDPRNEDTELENALKAFYAEAKRIAEKANSNDQISTITSLDRYLQHPSVGKILAINIGYNDFNGSTCFFNGLHLECKPDTYEKVDDSDNKIVYSNSSVDLLYKTIEEDFGNFILNKEYQEAIADIIIAIAFAEILDIDGEIRADILDVLEYNGLNNKCFTAEQTKKLKANLVNSFVTNFVSHGIFSIFNNKNENHNYDGAISNFKQAVDDRLVYFQENDISAGNIQIMYYNLNNYSRTRNKYKDCAANLFNTERDRLEKTVEDVTHDDMARFAGRYILSGIDEINKGDAENKYILNNLTARSVDYIVRPTPENEKKLFKVAQKVRGLQLKNISLDRGLELLIGEQQLGDKLQYRFHEIYFENEDSRLENAHGIEYVAKTLIDFPDEISLFTMGKLAVFVVPMLILNTLKLLAEFIPAVIEEFCDHCDEKLKRYIERENEQEKRQNIDIAYVGRGVCLAGKYLAQAIGFITMRVFRPGISIYQAYKFGKRLFGEDSIVGRIVGSILGAISLCFTVASYIALSVVLTPIFLAVAPLVLPVVIIAKLTTGFGAASGCLSSFAGPVMSWVGTHITTGFAAIGIKAVAGHALTQTTSAFAAISTAVVSTVGLFLGTGIGFLKTKKKEPRVEVDLSSLKVEVPVQQEIGPRVDSASILRGLHKANRKANGNNPNTGLTDQASPPVAVSQQNDRISQERPAAKAGDVERIDGRIDTNSVSPVYKQ